MVKTGNWTIAELMKYLVSVKSTLENAEIERLRSTPAFPMEIDLDCDIPGSARKKVKRYLASDLYEPLELFRELHLPLLDWGSQHEWKESSEEGLQYVVVSYRAAASKHTFTAKFLYSLGLRGFPPLEVILNLASSLDPKVNALALDYFLDNYVKKYYDYDPMNFAKVAFIPALGNKLKILGTPSEVTRRELFHD